MGFLRDVEKAIKLQNSIWLEHVEFYHGLELKAYKIKKDEHSRVYGRESGMVDSNFISFVGVIVNNDVIPVDDIRAGAFSNGMLYTTSKEVFEAGMIIEIPSEGEIRVRKFTIIEKQAYGQTTNVFHQYTLAAIGGP